MRKSLKNRFILLGITILLISALSACVQNSIPKSGKDKTGPATVYHQCDYEGPSIALGVGRYTLSQLVDLGIKNDDISSIKVGDGYRLRVYQDNNFQGKSRMISKNTGCLEDFNEKVSSLKIEKMK